MGEWAVEGLGDYAKTTGGGRKEYNSDTETGLNDKLRERQMRRMVKAKRMANQMTKRVR